MAMASPGGSNKRAARHSRCPNGTIYPSLVKLEQEGFVASKWDVSANNRKAKYYMLTRAGKKRVHDEARLWEQTVNIMARFFKPGKVTA